MSRRNFSYCSHRRLNNNKITSIASGAFPGLGRLTDLYVTMLCHITARVCTYSSCRYLYGNQITSIDSGAFTGLGSLTLLYATKPSAFLY